MCAAFGYGQILDIIFIKQITYVVCTGMQIIEYVYNACLHIKRICIYIYIYIYIYAHACTSINSFITCVHKFDIVLYAFVI